MYEQIGTVKRRHSYGTRSYLLTYCWARPLSTERRTNVQRDSVILLCSHSFIHSSIHLFIHSFFIPLKVTEIYSKNKKETDLVNQQLEK